MRSGFKDQRYRPFVNGEETETVPAFGLIALSGSYTYDHDYDGDEKIMVGWRPGNVTAVRQEAAFLGANGPTPVPPGARGMCTQDWPSRVLANGVSGFNSGSYVGPVEDEWYVDTTGSAFRVTSMDRQPLGSGEQQTIWIAPWHIPYIPTASLVITGHWSFDSNAHVPSTWEPGYPGGVSLESLDAFVFNQATTSATEPATSAYQRTIGNSIMQQQRHILLRSPGVYVGGFQVTLIAPTDAANSGLLGIRLYKTLAAVSSAPFPAEFFTGFESLHTYHVEFDGYGLSLADNVRTCSLSFCVATELANQALVVRSYSTTPAKYSGTGWVAKAIGDRLVSTLGNELGLI